MAYEVFGEETVNNFIYVPDSITAGSRIKCILTAYKEGETDITLETPPVTITEREAMSGSFVHISDFANGPKITVLPTNNIAFAVDDIQNQDGITYQFFIQDPIEAGLLVSGTGFSGTSGDYGSSLPSWTVDGVTVEHRPYFGGTTEGLTANVGDQTAYGAEETPIVAWTCKNAYPIDDDLIEGHYYVSLQAYHHSGIEKVQFQLNNGPVLDVTEVEPNPVDNVEEYLCKIDVNDSNLKTFNEVRALVYPNNGRKTLIQGFGYYDRERGTTGDLVDPTIDSDYVSYNTNGDNLYYNSLFLFKRSSGYSGEIYFDYENGSDDTGDGSFDNPYKSVGPGIKKHAIALEGGTSLTLGRSLDGYKFKLKPGNHIMVAGPNFEYGEIPYLGTYFPVTLESSDPNNMATIIGATGNFNSDGSKNYTHFSVNSVAIIRNLKIKEGEITYPSGSRGAITLSPRSFASGPRGKFFNCVHQENLDITYPNDTREILPEDGGYTDYPGNPGELGFKWGHAHRGDFNPNYPPSLNFGDLIRPVDFRPNLGRGLEFASSKTKCTTRFLGAQIGFGGAFSRGNVHYSGYADRGEDCTATVNNKFYGTSLECPTEVTDDIETNTSATAIWNSGTHVDVGQPGDPAQFLTVYKRNSYARVFMKNEAIHRDYTKKVDRTPFVITTGSSGGSNVFLVDGVTQATLRLYRGESYTFDFSGITPAHDFRIRDEKGEPFTAGFTVTGNTGTWDIPLGTDYKLYYYCENHELMGGEIQTGITSGVQKSQFWFNGDSKFKREPVDGYRAEKGQGVFKNFAFVNNFAKNHESSNHFFSESSASPGGAKVNYYVAGNTGFSARYGNPGMAIKNWTWKNNYKISGDPLVQRGQQWYSPSTLVFPTDVHNDFSKFYSPYFMTEVLTDPIPVKYSLIESGSDLDNSPYTDSDPGGKPYGKITYTHGTGGYDTWGGLDVFDKNQALHIYDGFSAGHELISGLTLTFIPILDENQENLKLDLLNVTDGSLRNMQRLVPYGLTLEYQWFKNDVILTGETGPTYTIDYSSDVGNTLSCGVTAQEILPGINPSDYRVGYYKNGVYIAGSSFGVPSSGQYIVGQPRLIIDDSDDTNDYYGFDYYIYAKENTAGGVSADVKNNVLGFMCKNSITGTLAGNQRTLITTGWNQSWLRWCYRAQLGNEVIHQPFRRLINLDTGATLDYYVGSGSGPTASGWSTQAYDSTGYFPLYTPEGKPKGYSANLYGEDSSITTPILNMIKDAATNNHRILLGWGRVSSELPEL